MDTLGKEGVDFSSQEKDYGEVVEKGQEDHGRTNGYSYATQKVLYVQGEEDEIELEEHGRDDGSRPAVTETNFLMRDNDIDGLKQYVRDNETSQVVSHGKDGVPGKLIKGSFFQQGKDDRLGSTGKDREGYEYDKQEKHDDSHDILRYKFPGVYMVNDTKTFFHEDEEARTIKNSKHNGDKPQNTGSTGKLGTSGVEKRRYLCGCR